jgi:hypothetical protein
MKNLIPLMKFAAIAGNVLFMLWMTYNVSYVGLMCLLILNSWLILSAEKRKTA